MVCDVPILPSTKIAALLNQYPELEEVLIDLAPPFKKLRNPVLRKGVARVASLQHAAAVAGLSVTDLVNTLRAIVGQPSVGCDGPEQTVSNFSERPAWFDANGIAYSIDERAQNGSTEMPIVGVLQKAVLLQGREILELITTFLPAPGIDIVRRKGFMTWSVKDPMGLVRTYISRPSRG